MGSSTAVCRNRRDCLRLLQAEEPPEIVGSGYVVQSLEAALWAFCKICGRTALEAASNEGWTDIMEILERADVMDVENLKILNANDTCNPPSFTKIDGSSKALVDDADSWVMVRDNVTGLIWENKTDDGTIHDKDNSYTWFDPTDPGAPNTEDFIKALNDSDYGGYSDWRLPTIKELTNIINYSIQGPTIAKIQIV